jgi:inner membrane transporter RhtA
MHCEQQATGGHTVPMTDPSPVTGVLPVITGRRASDGAHAPHAGRRRAAGIATLLGSGLSNQVGAAVGSMAFDTIGSVGVVVVRQFVAAAVLVPLGRPRVREYRWAQWWPVLLLALVFGTMNLSLYASIDRIGLGLAVTLEFLGPLGVALFASRSRGAVICALAAGGGVVAITHPEGSTDYLGVGLGLLAGLCWASYILLNRTVGRRIPGAGGSATAAAASAIAFVPIAIVTFATQPPTLAALGLAIVAGVLSSAVPYLADVAALRRVPAQLFGVLMSVNPIFAAVVGALVLGEALEWIEWGGIGLIVVANAVALVLAAPRRRDVGGLG